MDCLPLPQQANSAQATFGMPGRQGLVLSGSSASLQPAEFCLSAGLGSLLVVAVAVLRIYLGWAYVGDRLLSAAVEYEETGWYDGQVFVKPPEVLARDRLLGSYEVHLGYTPVDESYVTCPDVT